MRKDMLTIIKKEFARFFGDKNLFFTTVIMPGLVIYIMYTIMGQGMMKQFMGMGKKGRLRFPFGKMRG